MKKLSAIASIFAILIALFGCALTLYDAVERGDINTVKELIAEGAKTDVKEGVYAQTALHAAARNGRSDIIRILLDAGADVNSRDYWGDTALEYAAYKGSIESVKLLLDNGADVNSKDNHGKTPLIAAAEGYHTDIIKLLIDKGAHLEVAIAWTESKNPENWGGPAKLLAKFAQRQELGRASPALIISSNEVQPSPVTKSDIDDLPAALAMPRKNSFAVVIGIENYRQKLPKADFATQDARLVADYLTRVLGYSEENVVTLLNDRAALGDMAKYFEKWLSNNVEKDSTVFIYYSGHGAPDPKTGGAYIVPYDGDPSFIAETGYSLKRMYDALGKLPAKEVIVAIDSCFSGAGGRSLIAKGARPLVMNLQSNVVLAKNMTVLSASSGEQISSTYDEKGHGLFTYFLLKGIKNEDVVNPDGSIKMDDLLGYIKPQVERIARKQYNNEQTPQLIGEKRN